MVERHHTMNLNQNSLYMPDSFYSYVPTYSKPQRYFINEPEQQSIFRDTSPSFSLNRNKGLTISLKKEAYYKKQSQNLHSSINPQCGQQNDEIRKKSSSILTKTAHTIHYLGRSISKSKIDRNKEDQANKEINILQGKCTNSYHLVTNQPRNYENWTPKKTKITGHQKQRLYKVKITAPKVQIDVEQSKGSHGLSSSKRGKISDLKTKQFIRTSKNIKSTYKDNILQGVVNRLRNPPALLKNCPKNMQIKSKRQFLQSYISKPMINSIIVSGSIDNLSEQPQSPLQRLKKRLQLNSINCIFQKQTLVSHQIHQTRQSRIQVQESIIVHRNISKNFIPLTHKMNLFFERQDLPYKLYLARQFYSNLILTVKELPLEYFEKFTRQIRVHQEIMTTKLETNNILGLIKYSTDSDKHLLIKQPYTETLHEYLENYVIKKITREEFHDVICSIETIIRVMLINLEQERIFLKRKITLNDLVFVFLNLKFENMEMFEIGTNQHLDKGQNLKEFVDQMQSYYNRISSGSLNM